MVIPLSSLAFASVEAWHYPDLAVAPPELPSVEKQPLEPPVPLVPTFTAEQVQRQIEAARREAEADAEQRWAARVAAQQTGRNAQLNATLQAFSKERAAYFQQVETEIVHLALAIAKKILQREAELDPTLLAALVRIALDRMGAGPGVKLRLPANDLPWWQQNAGLQGSRYDCELLADDGLQAGDCIVETELGKANFGFNAQLKEVEQGLFDLLAQRPGER